MFLAADAGAFMSTEGSTFRKGVSMLRGTSRARQDVAHQKVYIYDVFRNETNVAKEDKFIGTVKGFVEGHRSEARIISTDSEYSSRRRASRTRDDDSDQRDAFRSRQPRYRVLRRSGRRYGSTTTNS